MELVLNGIQIILNIIIIGLILKMRKNVQDYGVRADLTAIQGKGEISNNGKITNQLSGGQSKCRINPG